MTERLPYQTWRKVGGMGFVAWLVVGLIAGWLAGQVMRGGGYGVVVDIILGLVGGVIGGWVFDPLGIWPGGGRIRCIVVAIGCPASLGGITRLRKTALPSGRDGNNPV